MHEQLYLAVSHIYGSMFRCLKMVKMPDVNNSDLKDTDRASLKKRAKRERKKYSFFYLPVFVTCVVFLHSGLSPLSLNPSISMRVQWRIQDLT